MALKTTEQPSLRQPALDEQALDQQAAEQNETCCGSSRRAVLRAAGVGGAVTAIGLTAAACSSSSSNRSAANPGAQDTSAAAAGASSAAASPGSGSGGGAGGAALAQTADIPVDGGKIVSADGGVVITQPAAGTYKAFTAVCTHQGCTVGSVSNNQITCPCHGSVFSAKDGSVVQGPAQAPLAAKNIKISGNQIFLA